MASSRKRRSPACFYCDIPTRPVIVYRQGSVVVRGWRCPKCGFTLLDPKDIKVAMRVVEGQKLHRYERA